MATIRDFNLTRLMPAHATGIHGTVSSARSGSVYTVATDAAGVVSCSCIGWLHDAESKRPKGDPRPRRAIADRWCSHLRGIRSGALTLTARYMPSDDRAERLAVARAELAKMAAELDACRDAGRRAELREAILSYSETVGYAAVAALGGET